MPFEEARAMHRTRTLVRLAVERLDPRIAPAVFTWSAGGSSGNFSDANNWAGKAAPPNDGTAELMFPPVDQLKTGAAGLTAINNLVGANGSTTFLSIAFMDDYRIEDVNGNNDSFLTTTVTKGVEVVSGTVVINTQLALPAGSEFKVNANAAMVAAVNGDGSIHTGTGMFMIADLNASKADPDPCP
jgi:hypothetical protein